MAIFNIKRYFESLARTVDVCVLLPDEVLVEEIKDNQYYNRPTKTLMLLHGYTGQGSNWLFESSIQELSQKYNLAVIMPSGENSYYLNRKGRGNAYETFVGKELIDYVVKTFSLSEVSEDICIAGMSMGGYGAIHTGLKYPNRYGKIAALSSALLVEDFKDMGECDNYGIADRDYYEMIFGNLNKVEETDANPKLLIQNLIKENKKIPDIFMACGTEDFLIELNRNFRDFLNTVEVQSKYYECEGKHDWAFWNKFLEPAIKWLVE